MRCAPLTRLALALDALVEGAAGDAGDPGDAAITAELIGYARAAEKAQLDFVTLPARASSGLVDVVAAATSRIGVLGPSVAAGVPERSGVVVTADGAGTAEGAGGGAPTRPGGLEPASVVAVEGPVPAAAGVALAADVFFVAGSASAAEVDALRDAAGSRTVRVFADLDVVIHPASTGTAPELEQEARVAGTAAQVMAELGRRKAAAGLDGFRLHPADPATQIPAILGELVPLLREHDAFRRGYETRTLRGHLTLPLPSPLMLIETTA